MRASIVFVPLLLIACSATTFNLPPVADQQSGQRLPGKFIWHDLISDDPAGSRRFYGELFGWSFRELSLGRTAYWVISMEKRPIGGMVDQGALPARRDVSQWVSLLSVEDAQQTRDAVLAAGGRVLREPVSLGQRGTIAVYTDNQGGVFATLQTRAGDPPDRTGLPPQGDFLWHELWVDNVDAATSFYAGLSGLGVEERDSTRPDDVPVRYRLLRDAAAPRAGIRDLPVADMPTLWMPYLRVRDEASLRSLLGRVAALGGEVLVPTTARPSGGHVAVIAGPSGAPIALQSWTEAQQLSLENDDA